jgi:hypothetical protein
LFRRIRTVETSKKHTAIVERLLENRGHETSKIHTPLLSDFREKRTVETSKTHAIVERFRRIEDCRNFKNTHIVERLLGEYGL